MTTANMNDQGDRASINHAQFEEMRELLDDEFIELVKTYISDSKKRVAEMRRALKENDNSAGFDAAHSLKGASANLGAHHLNNLCHDMQEACRANTITKQSDLLNNIEDEVEIANTEIETLINAH